MFDSPTSRFVLRACVFGAAAAVTFLLASEPIGWDDGVGAILRFAGGALAYAGIGAAVPQVEPHVGRKLKT